MEIVARWLSRYAGWILAVVVVLLLLCGLYSTHLNSRLTGGGWTVPGSQEARAERAQERRLCRAWLVERHAVGP